MAKRRGILQECLGLGESGRAVGGGGRDWAGQGVET